MRPTHSREPPFRIIDSKPGGNSIICLLPTLLPTTQPPLPLAPPHRWCAPAMGWRQREWWLRGGQQGGEEADDAVPPGLTIYYPERWLPAVGRPHFLACWTERQRLRRAQSILRTQGCQK